MSFAENLKIMRKYRRLTQAQLAEKSGVSLSSIINYENGRRKDVRKSVLEKLSFALEFPQSYFDDAAKLFTDGYIIGIESDKELFEPVKQVPREQELLDAYYNLNDDGQREAVKRVQELGEIPRYTEH